MSASRTPRARGLKQARAAGSRSDRPDAGRWRPMPMTASRCLQSGRDLPGAARTGACIRCAPISSKSCCAAWRKTAATWTAARGNLRPAQSVARQLDGAPATRPGRSSNRRRSSAGRPQSVAVAPCRQGSGRARAARISRSKPRWAICSPRSTAMRCCARQSTTRTS